MNKKAFLKLVLQVFILKIRFNICKSNNPAEKLCTDLLPDDYHIEKPSEEGIITDVLTWIQILDFGDINEAKMDFAFLAYVINIWNDSRLKVDSYKTSGQATILYAGCRDYIWIPDIIYESAKDVKADQKFVPSTLLKVLPYGAIYLSTLYSFRARCVMD
ncbi:hypothetical protein JTE90_011922 [Oedothorax gibbosus]|uniref:Neurotransmitter-gated ion-channel ligand-binding domain-containing protein n=2 Tax=Oedothorax gibbosus TaxID=931172 RepID=A0AAV6V0A0_9ARAC|nr:hypothetical protein JTE90_011922 [Oedothorax gibbosus]